MRCAVAALALVALPSVGAAFRLRRQNSTVSHQQDFELTLDNFQNVQYSAPFTLGPDQTLPVIYDTGSFEILVLSSLCHSCSANQIVYDNTRSRSFNYGEGIEAEHVFGSGPVYSKKGLETVRIGPPHSVFAAEHMPFWQVVDHQIEVWNNNAHFSGIIGLSFTDYIPEGFTVGPTKDPTILSVMGVKSFAICLARDRPDAPGVLAMGPSIDAMAREGAPFQTVPVVGEVHWGVRMTDFSFPGSSSPNPCVPSCGAIVDSGTSLIAVPRGALESISGLISQIKEDCSNMATLPVLRFQLEGATVELPPQAYVMKVMAPVPQNSSVWDNIFGSPHSEESMKCAPAFMTIDQESQFGPVWILGMPFLRYHYTVFDRADRKIHFAPASASCTKPSVGYSGYPGFVNASGLSRVSTGTRMFAPADFQPMQADLNAARAPAWAFKNKGNYLKI